MAAAYDWILANLLPDSSNHQNLTNIAVTGSLIGGSLALALGLTESHAYPASPRNARITAIAAHTPITDWLFHADPLFIASHKLSSVESRFRSSEIDYLTSLRALAFPNHKPSRYFDPFASPIHFLRSAARSSPPTTAAPEALGPVSKEEAEFEALTGLDVPPERRVAVSPGIGADGEEGEQGSSEEEAEARIGMDGRRFRRPLRWPPSGSGLVVPHVWLGVERNSVLTGQVEEMARLLRRAWTREGGTSDVSVDEGVCLRVFGDDVHEHMSKGRGDKEEEVVSRAEWLGKMLDA